MEKIFFEKSYNMTWFANQDKTAKLCAIPVRLLNGQKKFDGQIKIGVNQSLM